MNRLISILLSICILATVLLSSLVLADAEHTESPDSADVFMIIDDDYFEPDDTEDFSAPEHTDQPESADEDAHEIIIENPDDFEYPNDLGSIDSSEDLPESEYTDEDTYEIVADDPDHFDDMDSAEEDESDALDEMDDDSEDLPDLEHTDEEDHEIITENPDDFEQSDNLGDIDDLDEDDALDEEDEEEEEDDEDDEDSEIVDFLYLHIMLDIERNVTVIATEAVTYEVVTNDETEDISIIFDLADTESEVCEEHITFDLPERWVYIIEINEHSLTVTLFYRPITSLQRASFSPHFTPEEISTLWYATPDYVIELEATPATTVYTRLRAAIQDAPVNEVTHIVIPFHINTGTISSTTNLIRVPTGATVVLIGDLENAGEQVVISDTTGTGTLLRTIRLQGDGSEICALVLRNVVLQNAPTNTAQSTPESPPDPIALTAQTGNTRGGGLLIESTGGGGHLILCRGSVLRNNTAEHNGGAVEVQGNSRLTMMPGALIHENRADSAGGAIHLGGSRALFNMFGGEIRNCLARGTSSLAASAAFRASGGAVSITGANAVFNMHYGYIRENTADNMGGGVHVSNTSAAFNMYDGLIEKNWARGENTSATNSATTRSNGGGVSITSGTFNMYGGAIAENLASLGSGATAPTATNALVTSNGGGVFLTGSNASFHMYGGVIRNNESVRSRSSDATGTTNRNLSRAGNGGGVYLSGGSKFNMHGGYIQNNTATAVANSTIAAGDALHVSNGGGVYLTGANTTFHLHYGVIRHNEAIRTVNSVPPTTGEDIFVFAGNGGGVAVYDEGIFVMDDGDIYNNLATATGNNPAVSNNNIVFLANGGGVFLSGTGRIASGGGIIGPNAARVFLNGGSIRDNRAVGSPASVVAVSGNGGGVYAANRTQFHMTGGVISGNVATDANVNAPNSANAFRRGNGSGIHVRGRTTELSFTMTGGEVRNHTMVTGNGVGIFLSNGLVEIGGTALIEDNHSPGHGGGIYVEGTTTLRINGGSINNNTARLDGGGMYVANTTVILNMQSGSITNNIANDGGGLFVPHADQSANLNNVTINTAAVFSENTARNGVRINTPLAQSVRSRINPNTVSIAWFEAVDATSGNFTQSAAHAFNNYDINATGTPLWRVTYGVGSGEGHVAATVGNNMLPLPSGAFVPSNTTVTFDADTETDDAFDLWNIGVRDREVDAENNEIAFNFQNNTTGTPLSWSISSNTHVLGNFLQSLKLTTLSVSKDVVGALGNRDMDFGFTALFRDSDGIALPAGTQFDYIITESGTSVSSGTLTLTIGGSAAFRLRHNQTILINNAPLDGYIQIIEEPDANYTVFFTDSAYAGEPTKSNDTTSVHMTAERTFRFINVRVEIVPTGVSAGYIGTPILLFALISLGGLITLVPRMVSRHRKKRIQF
ncbi:MAG: hypothetical protein FWC75_00195 [Oscillospiraceae bacterium]|nr:hypothetical protein [Oscillospiraceae bacterium]